METFSEDQDRIRDLLGMNMPATEYQPTVAIPGGKKREARMMERYFPEPGAVEPDYGEEGDDEAESEVRVPSAPEDEGPELEYERGAAKPRKYDPFEPGAMFEAKHGYDPFEPGAKFERDRGYSAFKPRPDAFKPRPMDSLMDRMFKPSVHPMYRFRKYRSGGSDEFWWTRPEHRVWKTGSTSYHANT